MKGFIVAVALAAGLAGSTANPTVASPCGHAVTAREARALSGQVWHPDRWRRGDPPKRVVAFHRHQERCAVNPAARAAIKRLWARVRRIYYQHRRKMREQEAVTPYRCGGGVRSAIPCYIPWCESRFDFGARNSSSTAGGFYQIIDSTWYAYGGRYYADSHPAAVAPPLEQHRVARAIWADVGPSAWVCG